MQNVHPIMLQPQIAKKKVGCKWQRIQSNVVLLLLERTNINAVMDEPQEVLQSLPLTDMISFPFQCVMWSGCFGTGLRCHSKSDNVWFLTPKGVHIMNVICREQQVPQICLYDITSCLFEACLKANGPYWSTFISCPLFKQVLYSITLLKHLKNLYVINLLCN